MLAIITKASDDTWYEFKEIEKVEELLKIHEAVIVEPNTYENDFIKWWDGFKEKDIPLLRKAEMHITIYDDFIE